MLGFRQRAREREDIAQAIQRVKRVIMVDPDFDTALVDTLVALVQEPTSDPSVQLMRKISSFPPPPKDSIPELEPQAQIRTPQHSEEDLT